MRIEALLLAGLFFFGSAAPNFAQEAENQAAETSAEEDPGEAQGEGQPAEESEEAAPKPKKPIDVDEVIAKFNAGQSSPRTFTAEERDWIAAGLPAEEVALVYEGYAAIPSSDPNKLIFIRDGERHEIASNPDKNSPPVAMNVGPFAEEIDKGSFWLPVAASKTAKDVDAMFNFIMWTSYIFTAIIGGLMVLFCIKYRRRPGVRADQSITHNTPIEIIWSVLPTILVAIMFWGGYTTFLDMRTPPPDAMVVRANASQWAWNFVYENGVESPLEFHVPANTPVEMLMTSADVLHSFHLPAFRQKSDVLPNRYTKVWFESGEPATYRVYCSEYCGKSHSNMYAKLVVDSPEDYEAWMVKASNWMVDENGELKPPLEIGELTYSRKGCNACHSIDGSAGGVGPTFAGLWGLERNFSNSGSTVADENYIRQSILEPYSQLVQGYGQQMVLYNPPIPDPMIDGMIAYIKSLKDVPRQ